MSRRKKNNDGADVKRDSAVVLGLGLTGLRITSQLASDAGRDVRLLTVFPGEAPPGPSSVPVIDWPTDTSEWPDAGADLRRRIGSPRAAVIAIGLGAAEPVAISLGVVECLRHAVSSIAVVGVSPFSFEGPAKVELAREITNELGLVVDLFALVRRDNIRFVAPEETPLQQACRMVDDIAVQTAEAVARVLAKPSEAIAPQGVRVVGAGRAEDGRPPIDAVRIALFGSLLSREELRSSNKAMLALAMGRTPTIGEVCGAEDMLRSALARGAQVSFQMSVEPTLGDRALAAVCVAKQTAERPDVAFPAEDPTVLDVPAFLRRRSIMGGGRSAQGNPRWPRSA
jgi:cell division GTPase FtsZ